MRKPVTLTIALLPVFAALTGCGGSGKGSAAAGGPTHVYPYLDVGKVERTIEGQIQRQANQSVVASCPAVVPQRKNWFFNCTVYGAHGTTAKFQVVEKDARGNVHFQAVPSGSTGPSGG